MNTKCRVCKAGTPELQNADLGCLVRVSELSTSTAATCAACNILPNLFLLLVIWLPSLLVLAEFTSYHGRLMTVQTFTDYIREEERHKHRNLALQP